MKNAFKIVKKEMDKIFKFPRTIFSTILLPGIMIFVIYSIIGNMMTIEQGKIEEHISSVHVINSPESLDYVKNLSSDQKIDYIESTEDELAELQENIRNGIIDAVLFYENNFDELIRNGDSIPEVKIFYNPTENNSNMAYQKLLPIIESQKGILLSELNIDPFIFTYGPEPIFDEVKAAGSGLAMLLPILLLTFIFAGAMAVGSDAIAGEKERGTLATLLMTPIKRDKIILGKIISTTIIIICNAGSSFVGIIAALPFMKPMFGLEGGSIGYGAADYLGLFGIIFLLAVFASSLLLVTSTIARTVKEASMLAMPIYMTAMVLPIINMFSDGKTGNIILYILPIYNCILGIKGVLSMNMELVPYLLIVGSMLIYTVGLVFLLIRLFKSEKVIFSK